MICRTTNSWKISGHVHSVLFPVLTKIIPIIIDNANNATKNKFLPLVSIFWPPFTVVNLRPWIEYNQGYSQASKKMGFKFYV